MDRDDDRAESFERRRDTVPGGLRLLGDRPPLVERMSPGSAEGELQPLVDRGEQAPPPDTRTRTLGRWVAVLLVLVMVLVAAGLGVVLYLQHKYDANIERFGDPFIGLPDDRPQASPDGAVNILLLGSDSRVSAGDPSAWEVGAQRTDAIMLAHVAGDRSGVSVTSIPRDSWVNIPGRGMNKINAAFSFGGPSLMVRTVEKVTGIRIDHVAIADFDGFVDVTDAVGGVDIDVEKATKDERGKFAAGPQLMDGETALRYVRQRHNLPGGDFDRVKRQQNWIRAVLTETLSAGTLTSPGTMNRVLGDLSSSLAVDDGFSIGDMRSLAFSLRGVRGDSINFMTAPVAGTGWSPDHKQAIVRLDPAAGARLWKAVGDDTLPAWLASNPAALLGSSVR